jgi:hypothetical protein
MKHLELVLDDTYGHDLEQALRNIQAEAERQGVPTGTRPNIKVDPDPEVRFRGITTYRWEWEKDEAS